MSSPHELFLSTLAKAGKFVSKQSKIYLSDISVKDLSKRFEKICIEHEEFDFLLEESKKKCLHSQGFIDSELLSPIFNTQYNNIYKKLKLFFDSHSYNAYIIGMEIPNVDEYIFPTDAYQFLYPKIGNSDSINIQDNLERKDAQIFEFKRGRILSS